MEENDIHPFKRQRARQFRLNPTPPEAMLWEKLKNKGLGVQFQRQRVILGYIADFYCGQKNLLVEVDGKLHDLNYDNHRDSVFRQHGYYTHRIPAHRIFNDLFSVLKELRIVLGRTPNSPVWVVTSRR